MRTLWPAITLAFMAFSFVTGASAQDGLKRFETDIKPQIELKSFTYGSASAQGSSGFVLNDVVAVVPGNGATGGKDSTIKIEKGIVDDLQFQRLKENGHSYDVPPVIKLKM